LNTHDDDDDDDDDHHVVMPHTQVVEDGVTNVLRVKGAFLTSFSSTIGASLVPAVVSVINSAMPVLIKFMTSFEKWDGAQMTIKQLVIRWVGPHGSSRSRRRR